MKPFIPNNYVRCNNDVCPKKDKCKRFVQHQLDVTLKETSSFVTIKYSQSFCEKFLKF